jgi:hypothetical protein
LKKFLPAALTALALFAASTAHAATMLFQFDPAHSSVTISGNGNRTCVLPSNGCALSANLMTPFSDMTIAEGASQTLDFANFHISPGFGFDNYVQVDATLAFLTPDAGPASTTGQGSYFHTSGFLWFPPTSGGSLTWAAPVQHFTTPDGSEFTVTFNDINGLTFGSDAIATIGIAVNSIAAGVPEPGTWAMMIVGLGLMGAALRRRPLAGAVSAA